MTLQHQIAQYISLMMQLKVMYSLNKSDLWILYLCRFFQEMIENIVLIQFPLYTELKPCYT